MLRIAIFVPVVAVTLAGVVASGARPITVAQTDSAVHLVVGA